MRFPEFTMVIALGEQLWKNLRGILTFSVPHTSFLPVCSAPLPACAGEKENPDLNHKNLVVVWVWSLIGIGFLGRWKGDRSQWISSSFTFWFITLPAVIPILNGSWTSSLSPLYLWIISSIWFWFLGIYNQIKNLMSDRENGLCQKGIPGIVAFWHFGASKEWEKGV